MFERFISPHPHTSVVAINTSAQLIGKAIGAGTTFILSLSIARQFGASGFGDFVKITTFVSFFFLMADFGLNATYIQRSDAKALPSLFGLRIIGGVALTFLCIGLLAFIPQTTTEGYTPLVRFGILIFAPAVLFQALITSANAVFQKYMRYVDATLAVTAGALGILGIVWFMWVSRIQIGGSVLGVIALLCGSIITAVVSLSLARRITPLSVSFSLPTIAPLFVATIPLGLTLMSNVIYAHADSVILTLSRTTVDVGTYGLAYKVFETFLVLPTFFMNAVYPIMIKTYEQQKGFVPLIKKAALFLGASAVFLGVLSWICAPYLVLIRSDFAQSVLYLRVLSLSLPFFFLSSLTMWMLITIKRQWMLATLYVFGMTLNIVLNVWLVPTYGPFAAAWITVLSEGVILALSIAVLFPWLSRIHKT